MQRRDSIGNTILVALVLCVVCSLAVSAAAVVLRPIQAKNKQLDQQRNILDATGLAMGEYGKPASQLSAEKVAELYEWISEKLVNLEDGSYNTEIDPETYDPREVVDDKARSVEVVAEDYNPGIGRREKVAKVFFVKRPGEDRIRQIVLPVYGKGLWSTMYGYLAMKSDLETIQGLTFYEHGETPGLGGEVDNPRWKQQWEGKLLFDDSGQPAAKVSKGPAPPGNPYSVDGLSGATITSNGVTNLINYWAGDDGYGPFMKKLRTELNEAPAGEETAGVSPSTGLQPTLEG
ncbi:MULTISPECIES: Na(+)-translocating NADH-quinone reductase subunit C [Crateriforma]|uniref:Na(+)-translocating NADH-quinone reductase subunit C n=1 Tax=Crateriforma conspicua TaxID=2527996 RepID=A0A5C6FUV5_9PLAN|nr:MULTISPECIES: Na(+)-translocating NADH-quinone reductase subunit C [Crateriforma]TWU66074.1 Na(+)-translocating NADH-quinone reductase subunit C [Crateriforma conspicua]